MAKQNVAEQFVDILTRAGVKRLYGVVGDSLNPVVDAVRRNTAIDWIHVRHEEIDVAHEAKVGLRVVLLADGDALEQRHHEASTRARVQHVAGGVE